MALRVNKTALIILVILALAIVGGAVTVTSWFLNKEARARQFLDEARTLSARGEDDVAIIQYQNVIKYDPENTSAYIELAAIYSKKGDLNNAYKYYRTVSEKDPYNVEVLSKLAGCYNLAGQWEDLKKTAARIVSLNPGGQIQASAHYYLGQADYREGNYTEAAVHFGKAAELDRDNLDAVLALGLVNALYLDSPTEAELALNTLLSRASDTTLSGAERAEAALRASKFYATTGKETDAEELLKTTVSLSNDPKYLVATGDFYRGRGRNAENLRLAEQAYKDALEVAPSDASALLSLGIFYRENQRTDKAVEVFSDAVAKSPAPIFYQHLIESLLDRRDIDGATKRLAELRRIDNAQDIADYLEGRIYLMEAKDSPEGLRKAEQLFARVAKVMPQFAQAHYYYGVCLATRGMLDDAELEFQRALNLAPNFTQASDALAETYMRAYRFDRAITQARYVLEKDSNDFDANLIAGRALLAQGSLTAAENYLAQARALKPSSVKPYVALADLYSRRAEYDRAVATLEEAAKVTDEPSKALMALAILRRQQGESDEAVKIAAQIAAKDPKDTNAANFYCSMLWRQDRASDAIDFLKDRIAKYPDDLDYLNLLGNFQQSLGRPEEAAKTYGKVLAAYPSDSEALKGQAGAYVALEDYAKAREKIVLLRKADPGSPTADLLEARILHAEGNADAAASLLSNSLRQNAANPEAHYRMALIEEERGELDKAIVSFKESLKYNPSSLSARLGLAQAYYRTRFYDDALREAQKITSAPLSDMSAVERAVSIAAGSLLETKRVGDAISQWEQLPPEIKSTGDYIVKMGYLYLMDEQYEKAAEAFRKGAALLEQPAPAYEGLAQVFMSEKRLEEALSAIETALSTDTDSATRLRMLQTSASISLALGDKDSALEALENMLEAAGDNTWLLLQAGDSFHALGQQEKAIETYRRAIAVEPGSVQAKKRLVVALTAAGSTDEASGLIDEVLKADPDNFESLVLKGRALLAEGENDKASDLLSRALAQPGVSGKSAAVAHYLLATAQYESGFYPAAESELRRALAQDPSLTLARVLLAEVLLRSRSYEEAAVEAREVLKTNPGLSKARGLLADALMLSGGTEEAISEYRKALASENNPAILRALVGVFVRLGRSQEAIAELKAYVADVPSDSEASWLLARMYEEDKDYAEAEKVLRGALEASPGTFDLEQSLAALYKDQKRYEEAEALLKAAIDDHPGPAYHRLLAGLYVVAGRDGDAERTLSDCIKKYPAFLPAYVDLAQQWAGRRTVAEAVSLLKTGISENSDNEAFYVALAGFYIRLGMNEDAMKFLAESSENNPGFSEITCTLGDLHFVEGDAEQALAAYERALKFSPESARAANGVAYMLVEKGADLQRAIDLATKALLWSPNDPNIMDTLGWAYYRSEQFDKAVVNLAGAVAASADPSATYLYHLTLAYDKMGASSRAMEMAQKLVESDPTYGDDEAIKRILAGS